jgi:hypothetical protein
MQRVPCRSVLLLPVVIASIACGGDDDGRTTGNADSIGLTGASSLGTGGTDDPSDTAEDNSNTFDPVFDLGVPDTDADPSGNEECASEVTPAENKKQPADIIVVVDNSGSMDFEAGLVQTNLNSFSQQIIDSGIDVHVVLMSSYPGDGNGICIDPPLGSGGCNNNDNNPPLFTHIDQRISSNDALEQILDHHANWSVVLRPDAQLHFMVVTDDESDLPPLDFDNQLKALSPNYALYRLNGIVCTSNCEEAAAIGDTYVTLGQLTGGIIGDLCLQDFQPVFDALATEVISGAQIACEWDIPPPPEGEDFDPTKVNVEFDDGMGGGFEIGYVESEAECANVIDGWYYDNPAAPTLILACPQTCQKIQGVDAATINISLGCDTIPAG